MQINELLKTIKVSREKKGQPRSNREDILNQILSNINEERIGTKYKPLNFVGLKELVKHMNDADLHWFLTYCSKAQSFGKAFFGMIRFKK